MLNDFFLFILIDETLIFTNGKDLDLQLEKAVDLVQIYKLNLTADPLSVVDI